jgi:lauroyl/myristoyl acyltransferase
MPDSDDGSDCACGQFHIPEALQEDLSSGGVMFVSGHFGVWELSSAVFDPLHMAWLIGKTRTQVV